MMLLVLATVRELLVAYFPAVVPMGPMVPTVPVALVSVPGPMLALVPPVAALVSAAGDF